MTSTLLNRLRLWQKFALLGMLALLLVEPPLGLYVVETNEAIDFTAAQRQAIAPGRAALALLQFVQQHRGLSAAFLGAGGLAEARRAKQAEADQMLGTLEAELARVPALRGLMRDVRPQWTELAQGVTARRWTLLESYDRHTALARSLVEQIERISDESGLALDPEAVTYFLMRATYVDLPAATEALGELRAKGASLLAVRRIEPDERTLMHELVSRADSTGRQMVVSLDKAFAVDPALQARLKPTLELASARSQEAQRLGRDEVTSAATLSYPVAGYLEVLTTTIDTHFVLVNLSLQELDNLLLQRMAQKRFKRNALVLVVLLVGVAAALITWRISLAIRQPMQQTVEIARAIAAGQINTEIAPQNGAGDDEGATMLLALGQMQKSLRQAMATEKTRKQDFFRDLLEAAPDAMVIVNREGAIILVNAQTVTLFGYPREALLGQPIEMLLPERLRGQHVALRNGFFGQPAARPMGARQVLMGCRRDGSEFPAEVSLSPLQTEDGLVVASSVHDISARKQAEQELERHRHHLEELVAARTAELERSNVYLRNAMEQLVQAEKMASLGRVVAGVAHELNTPVGNALLMASSLTQRAQDFARRVASGGPTPAQWATFAAECQEASAVIERNCGRAAALVSSFKQVAVDQASGRRRKFKLRDLLDEVIATHRNPWSHTLHRIEVEVAQDIELDGYPGPLEQVVANLLDNSRVHGFDGVERGLVQISAHTDGGQVRLLFADDGCGIAPHIMGKVFDPFFTTRLGRGGSGLGLYLVHKLVTTVLGGSIQVRAGAPRGCVFELCLPLVAPAAAQEPAAPAPAV
jgi:PAS domain S-box-containing protein